MSTDRALPALALALACLGLCSCAAGEASKQASAAATRKKPPRIAVLVMENKEYGNVIGNPSAPYINSLAKRYALAESYYAIRHPSLPNYLALTGGATFDIQNDCTDCHVRAASLPDQLDRAKISWKAYMEDMRSSCFQGAQQGGYAKKHNPFIYYDAIAKSHRRCSRILTFAELDRDLARGSLPRFAWITPNLCHDMHDCSVSTGDRFLSHLVPRVLNGLGRRGVLFLTWDEGNSEEGCCRKALGGHVATIVAGAGARAGARSSVPYDHYSLLRTVEDIFRLRHLGNAGCSCTRPMSDLLSRSGRRR